MKHLNKKEKHLKSIADDFQISINTNAVWDSIEDRLPKKRRRYGLIWMSIGLIISTAFFTYFATVSSMSAVHNPTSYSDSNIDSHSKQKEIKIAPSSLSDLDKSLKTDVSKSVSITKPSKNIQKSFFTKKMDNPQANHTKPTNTSQPTLTKAHTEKPFFHPLNTVESQKIKLIHKEQNLKFPKIDLKNFNTWTPYMKFYTGIHQANFHYYPQDDTKNMLFDRETGKIGTTFGFLYGKTHTLGWGWNIGFNFQQSVAEYKYQYESISTTNINGISAIFIDEKGDEHARKGQVVQNTLNLREKRMYRKQNAIDVNIGIEKQLFHIKRMDFKLGTGIGITAFSKHTGYYFKDNNTLMKIQNEDHPYKIKGQVKHFTNAMMDYTILPHYSLGLQFNYTYALNSLTKNSNFYKLKNSQYGIYFTISYRPY